MQKHTVKLHGLLHNILFPEALQTTSHNEGDTPLHMETRSDTYIAKNNKEDKYPWLDKMTEDKVSLTELKLNGK